MNEVKRKIIFERYIDSLLKNQNNTNIPFFQDIYTEKDYEKMLKCVVEIMHQHPHASYIKLRTLLFANSGLKETIDRFIYETKIAPGLVVDFGTARSRDTVVCGNKQEVILQNGQFIPKEIPIEANTIFGLASTSKTFTAIAILKLEELGLIDIYEPITRYVPEFAFLNEVSIYDLLKFRVMIVTDERVDQAHSYEEAEQILFKVHPKENQNFNNAYTDMGAMVLKYVVERTTNMKFTEFVNNYILSPLNLNDTFLNVPEDKLYRVANDNYSSIITKDGTPITKFNTFPGVPHDAKAYIMNHAGGNAPGHAGYFSTSHDLITLAHALIDNKILSKESLESISETATGFVDDNGFTRFYGSLVYLKQPDPRYLSVYPPLSGKAFMSPGFGGTTLVVDPLNKISLFIGAPRLHNRIYQIHPEQLQNIKIDEFGKQTFMLPDGTEKVISSHFTQAKEVVVRNALNLALQYQLLEKLHPYEQEVHLVRELN